MESRNEPLVQNRIEAWQYGPVIPDVYRKFRPQGASPSRIDPAFPAVNNTDDVDFLEQIYNIYGQMSPFRLSELTHQSGGPWEAVLKWGGSRAEIPDDLIKSHYVSKRQSSLQANA